MTSETSVSDADPDNWVDRYAPRDLRPYLRLMRADRPIGVWLLLWPCWWSLALVADHGTWPNFYFMLLFALGAILLRGAGCTLNDLVDRDYDARVARTRDRPLATGAVTPVAAIIFFLLLSFSGLLVLLQFNDFTVALGLSSLGLVAVYPLAKRITHWPQLVLGLTFNWGALLGWSSVTAELALPALLLYAGGVFWTLGYDTVYALQDIEDDAVIGVKSTALLFEESAVRWIAVFYIAAAILFLAAGLAAGKGAGYLAVVAALATQLMWQVRTLEPDSRKSCLRIFKSNTYAGWIFFLGLVLVNLL